MSYFFINGKDLSSYTNSLKVKQGAFYTEVKSIDGSSLINYKGDKKVVEVGLIPLDESDMRQIASSIFKFNSTIKFRNPYTGNVEELEVILPEEEIEYYTIQQNKVTYQTFTLTFYEL